MMDPIPPISEVPPITAAATACNSIPSPRAGRKEFKRNDWIIPAKPARTEQIMKQAIFTLPLGMPIAAAAGKKPPVARTQLPKFVLAKSRLISTAIATNQMTDARINPPSSTKPVKIQLGT